MPGEVAAERLTRLQRLLDEQKRRFNASMVGRTLPVLFERHGRHPGQVAGRTPYMQWLHVGGAEALIGTIAKATVTDASPNGLAGVLAGGTARAPGAAIALSGLGVAGGVPA